jgi:SH3 domain-containing YSC84-like protein 1
MRNLKCSLLLTLAAALCATAADQTATRLNKAAAVFASMTDTRGITREQLASADCIAVIPGFKKGAAVVGVGFGRGFISCRDANGQWSAPGAISLETTSLGVQIGGEEIDLVILSRDKNLRPKLLSDRFTVGADASAAWGNGKSAHDDPSTQVVFFSHTKGVFAGFGLDGATIKPDDSSDKALYGKPVTNGEVVDGSVAAPPAAQGFVASLSPAAHR